MEKPIIISCLIVKNEEDLLSRCLDSIKGVDHIYIADTGSDDKTVEIARKYTDKVWTDYKWNDSFCEARNYILNKAKEDFKGHDNVYCLSIDADEFLHDFSKLQEAVEEANLHKIQVIDCKLYSDKDKQLHYYPRLFKVCDEVWWEGVAHNHISMKPAMVSEVEITYGYSPAHLKDPNRTLRILTKEVEKNGGPRETFYLGREYWYRNQYRQCAEQMEKYIVKSQFMAEKADAYVILARCYWYMGRGDEARTACANAIIINPNFKEAVLFMSRLAGRGTGNPLFEKNGDWWFKASELCDNSGVLFIRDTTNGQY